MAWAAACARLSDRDNCAAWVTGALFLLGPAKMSGGADDALSSSSSSSSKRAAEGALEGGCFALDFAIKSSRLDFGAGAAVGAAAAGFWAEFAPKEKDILPLDMMWCMIRGSLLGMGRAKLQLSCFRLFRLSNATTIHCIT